MKSLLLCLLLFGVLLGFCIFTAFSIHEIVQKTEELLNQAVAYYRSGNRTKAAELIDYANRCWKRNETFFGTLIRHDTIDEVEMEFAGLKAYAGSDDEDDFLCTSAKLISSLRHIRDMEWPFIRNIF